MKFTPLLISFIVGFNTTVGHAHDRETKKIVAHLRGTPITVYTYRPKGCLDPQLLFVFHGLGRDAPSYRDYARKLANDSCMIIFAPLFDKERFPVWRYQRGGIIQDQKLLPREQWAVSFVSDLVTWARRKEGKPTAPFYLFGHSAGAQFLSRVASFHPPLDASRIVISNPSTYVLPSTNEPAPYGLGGVFGFAEGETQLRRYLELPITIYLGEDDTSGEHLSQTASAMQQGNTRLERGRFVFGLAKSTAQAKGWSFRWRLVTVPGVGHSVRSMLQADEAIKALAPRESEMAP